MEGQYYMFVADYFMWYCTFCMKLIYIFGGIISQIVCPKLFYKTLVSNCSMCQSHPKCSLNPRSLDLDHRVTDLAGPEWILIFIYLTIPQVPLLLVVEQLEKHWYNTENTERLFYYAIILWDNRLEFSILSTTVFCAMASTSVLHSNIYKMSFADIFKI